MSVLRLKIRSLKGRQNKSLETAKRAELLMSIVAVSSLEIFLEQNPSVGKMIV